MDRFDATTVEALRGTMHEAEELYKQCKYDIEECEKRQQDILHELELVDHSYHERAKLAEELIEVRRKRRDAKNQLWLLEPFIAWKESNKKVINDLSSVLGQIRKIEERQNTLVYHKKTENDTIIKHG